MYWKNVVGLRRSQTVLLWDGTMTGSLLASINAPVTKSISAVLALTHTDIHSGTQEECIGCGACVRACPVALSPIRLYNMIEANKLHDAHKAGLMQCIECGLCSYVCPSRIPLAHRFQQIHKHKAVS